MYKNSLFVKLQQLQDELDQIVCATIEKSLSHLYQIHTDVYKQRAFQMREKKIDNNVLL